MTTRDTSRRVARAQRYRPYPKPELSDRRWPDRTLDRAPIWCSVDLRDGNQALVEPMGRERKLRFFQGLVALGFEEIEVGFPSASSVEYDFVREIIEQGHVPANVTIQVLTQARDEQIDRTMEAIRGARRAIFHVYNSTSPIQREVVFGMDRPEIVAIAVRAVERIKALAAQMPETEIVLEYSPESFSGTEVDFAVEICEAVLDAWGATPQRPVILNLPATVEMASPNIYADQIELFCRGLRDRERAIVSVHPHNDRGCAVAAAELALLAGAERVEGTLFGNGERTGNVDVVTLAINMMTQGVDPGLAFDDIDAVVALAEYCNRLPVHPRHPWAGELVFTAFSGSHQDAIRKGLAAVSQRPEGDWEVPYLPLDPADVGRSYEAVIRINSQSGKGGVSYVMERDFGFALPRGLQVDFSRVVQRHVESSGGELGSEAIWDVFEAQYVSPRGPFVLEGFDLERDGARGRSRVRATFAHHENRHDVAFEGAGPLEAFVDGLAEKLGVELRVVGYWEHALSAGSDACAAAYVELELDGVSRFGVGTSENIVEATFRAVVAGLNRVSAATGFEPRAATDPGATARLRVHCG